MGSVMAYDRRGYARSGGERTRCLPMRRTRQRFWSTADAADGRGRHERRGGDRRGHSRQRPSAVRPVREGVRSGSGTAFRSTSFSALLVLFADRRCPEGDELAHFVIRCLASDPAAIVDVEGSDQRVVRGAISGVNQVVQVGHSAVLPQEAVVPSTSQDRPTACPTD